VYEAAPDIEANQAKRERPIIDEPLSNVA
jgi:hypothetical protein